MKVPLNCLSKMRLHKFIKKLSRFMLSNLIFFVCISTLFLTIIQFKTMKKKFQPLYQPQSEFNDLKIDYNFKLNSSILDKNNYSNIYDKFNKPNINHMIISSNRSSLIKAKRSDPFKIESLLNKSPPAFQTNNREMNKLSNTGRIKKIIKDFLILKRNEKNFTFSNYSINELNQNLFNHCTLTPSKLVGRIKIDLSFKNLDENFLNKTNDENDYFETDGFFLPKFCLPNHKVAVIIPYRDRFQHLKILLKHLHGVLQRQLLFYKIFVIEQFGNDTFNKGVLMNAGSKEATSEQFMHCFIFHDVDLIPEDDRNLYSCPPYPRHLSVAVDKFNYSLPYSYLVGGVLAISQTHFNLVNGYSNLYWGWGGEDDDLSFRLKFNSLLIIRPPESIGRYTMIKHNHRVESPNNVRFALLKLAKKRSSRDGLNSVHYKVVERSYNKIWGFEHIVVQIGDIHKWQFPAKNKLILHF